MKNACVQNVSDANKVIRKVESENVTMKFQSLEKKGETCAIR